MKTIENPIVSNKIQNLHNMFETQENVLFFDIETTGFSSRTAMIYLIGCAFYKNSGWRYRQFFAESPSEEKELLKSFSDFVRPFSLYIHFNGQTFDVPFLAARYKRYALPMFTPVAQCDIYKCISPFKNMLHLPGCRQKQLEEFIGIDREDIFNGGQLIELYRAFCETGDERLLKTLLLHNSEDLAGMLPLYALMAIPKLFDESAFQVQEAHIQDCRNANGDDGKELIILLSLPAPLPVAVTCHTTAAPHPGCFFTGRDSAAVLRVPVFSGELKFFYPDYKNYSYLPAEDQAIHKSVAVYVDKSQRIPATAATCYTRRSGHFLPLYSPFRADLQLFYREYKAKDAWFLPDGDFLKDSPFLRPYITGILQYLKKNKSTPGALTR